MPPRPGQVVRNWGGNPQLTWRPGLLFTATSEDEVRAAIQTARHDGRRLKVLGARHSYSGVLNDDDGEYALDVSRMVVPGDGSRPGAAILSPGQTLKTAVQALDERGLALANLGTHAAQTVAGAVATNTHGTGRAFPGLSGMVKRLDVIDGLGRIHRGISRDHEPELFLALRSGLGILGVTTSLTLDVRPQFNIALERTVESLPPFFDQKRIDNEVSRHDWFELYVLPYTKSAVVIRKNETAEPVSPGRGSANGLAAVWRWLQERFRCFVVNDLYKWLVAVMLRAPGLADEIFALQRLFLATQSAAFVDRSDRALLAEYERNPWQHLWEIELFFPVAHTAECLQRVCEILERGKRNQDFVTEFPIHVRTVRGDDSYLSPAYCPDSERTFGVISVPQNPVNDRADLFEALTDALDAIMDGHRERPVGLHWGKNRYTGLKRLEERYPGLEAFRQVRQRLDPDGVFLTPWAKAALKIDGG